MTADLTLLLATLAIMTGALVITGVPTKLGAILIEAAGVNLAAMVVLAFIFGALLGTGLPPAPTYILVAIVIAPPMIRVGVNPWVVHFFAFFLGVWGELTPPTSIVAAVTAKIANASFYTTLNRALQICVSLFTLMAGVFVHPELVIEPGIAQFGAAGLILTATIGITFSLQARFADSVPVDVAIRLVLAALVAACAALSRRTDRDRGLCAGAAAHRLLAPEKAGHVLRQGRRVWSRWLRRQSLCPRLSIPSAAGCSSVSRVSVKGDGLRQLQAATLAAREATAVLAQTLRASRGRLIAALGGAGPTYRRAPIPRRCPNRGLSVASGSHVAGEHVVTQLRILGRANSFNVRKVLWTCDELGIAYTREDWGRGFKPTSQPEFLRINPLGLVPAVIDNGDRSSASRMRSSIPCHQIRRRGDLSERSVQRARIEQWMDWANYETSISLQRCVSRRGAERAALEQSLVRRARTQADHQRGRPARPALAPPVLT